MEVILALGMVMRECQSVPICFLIDTVIVDFVASLQLLTLSEQGKESNDERQGKMLLHTEYSLLSLLHNQEGVVHHHGLFQVSNCRREGFLSSPHQP